ncbi:ribonucleoside-diphosphate reductase, partial [Lacticaseibacillus paracasei]|uniref:ribonucleoside-diphosphate reductase n=1 Tax=Lacticaseibacillus paracasei TaxID=1597 RepID=UPI001C1DEF4B
KLSREEKHMQAIIYTRPGCQKCRRTVFKLSQVMPVQTITADADDYERFRKLGYQSFPVVTVYKANGTHETWCDMRTDKIKQYTEE